MWRKKTGRSARATEVRVVEEHGQKCLCHRSESSRKNGQECPCHSAMLALPLKVIVSSLKCPISRSLRELRTLTLTCEPQANKNHVRELRQSDLIRGSFACPTRLIKRTSPSFHHLRLAPHAKPSPKLLRADWSIRKIA